MSVAGVLLAQQPSPDSVPVALSEQRTLCCHRSATRRTSSFSTQTPPLRNWIHSRDAIRFDRMENGVTAYGCFSRGTTVNHGTEIVQCRADQGVLGSIRGSGSSCGPRSRRPAKAPKAIRVIRGSGKSRVRGTFVSARPEGLNRFNA
jgi:hypothetical protein